MTTEELHQFIQALAPREQRYVQLQLGTYRKKQGSLVQRLYQLMASGAKLDEDRIKAQLLRDKPERQFHVLRNQLYHQLLEVLIRFRGEQHPVDQVGNLMHKSRILQEKRLYREANRFLKRAAKLAEQHDHFEQLLLIYKDWKRLYAWILEVDKRARHIERFWEKEQEALDKLRNLRTLEWLSMRVFDLYYRIHYARNDRQIRQYEELMDHPLLQDEETSLSFSARVIFLNTHGLYEDAVGRKAACLNYRRQLVRLYEEHPERLKEQLQQYLAAFNNYLLVLIHEGQFTETSVSLDELEKLPETLSRKMRSAEKVMWFRACYSLRLEVAIRQGNFKAALELLPKVNARFAELDKDLNPAFRFPFHYFFAYTCFALNRYDEALDHLQPLIYQVELQFKQELFRFARLLQLIIHLERGDYEYLSSLIRSTRRFLRRLGGTHPLEEQLLRFLAKAPYVNPREAFANFEGELSKAAPHAFSAHVSHHFDFRAWIGARVKDRPFADIFQEIRK